MRPMLMIDVGGPLNPYAAKPTRRPEGYQTHHMLTPGWEAEQASLMATLGETGKTRSGFGPTTTVPHCFARSIPESV